MMPRLRAVWIHLRTLWGAPSSEHVDADAVAHTEPRSPAVDGGAEWSLRLPRALLSEMWADLNRPHDFAHERVGFLLARQSEGHGGRILLARHYEPVPEDDYIRDPSVGARINRESIRRMLKYALDGETVACEALGDPARATRQNLERSPSDALGARAAPGS